MGTNDNTLADRGLGNWEFILYNPFEKEEPIRETISGRLFISKDHYYVMDKTNPAICWYNVAVQNVARVMNKLPGSLKKGE